MAIPGPVRVVNLFAVLLSSAAAVAHAQNITPKPDPRVAVQVWKHFDGDGRSQTILMRNDSKLEITIINLQLNNCVNLREECGIYPVNKVLPPGQVVEIKTLTPGIMGRPYTFGWSFNSTGPRPPQPSGAPEMTGSGTTSDGHAIMLLNDPEKFVPMVAIGTEPEVCLIGGKPRGGVHVTGMTYALPDSEPVRVVTIFLDESNTPTRYMDERGDIAHPHDAAHGAYTMINIDLSQMLGRMQNTGNGREPDNFFTVKNSNMMTAPSLGAPGTTMQHILDKCGKSQ